MQCLQGMFREGNCGDTKLGQVEESMKELILCKLELDSAFMWQGNEPSIRLPKAVLPYLKTLITLCMILFSILCMQLPATGWTGLRQWVPAVGVRLGCRYPVQWENRWLGVFQVLQGSSVCPENQLLEALGEQGAQHWWLQWGHHLLSWGPIRWENVICTPTLMTSCLCQTKRRR